MHASSSLGCSLVYPPMQSIIVTCHPPGSLCTHNAIHSLMASYKRKQGFSSFTYLAHVQLNACQTKHTFLLYFYIFSYKKNTWHVASSTYELSVYTYEPNSEVFEQGWNGYLQGDHCLLERIQVLGKATWV